MANQPATLPGMVGVGFQAVWHLASRLNPQVESIRKPRRSLAS